MQSIAHAAGALGQDSIHEVTQQRFWEVCSPKVVGGDVAAEMAASELPLLEISMFSSTAAAWSQPSACHYSAANSALDALASQLRYVPSD